MRGSTFLDEHRRAGRRFFLKAGLSAALLPAISITPASARQRGKAGVSREPYFTPNDEFSDVSRGTPLPHSLSEDRRKAVGLTRETWRLEVVSDKEYPARIRKPMTAETGSALDFDGLMKLAEKNSVKFAKVMTCLNLGCPLGMGVWEGVPLRDVVWRTQPRENLRRVFYYGFHNDDPKQMFRSSLPIGRVLEDPAGLPPVILCYKLNDRWLSPKRGGPVRLVVPEAYGFKSIKWLSHVVLTNLAHANDTYAEQNNDVDSPLKTFAAPLSVPDEVKADQRIPVSGYCQVGVGGLSKVQVSLESNARPRPDDDPYFETAPWVDAEILPAPRMPIGTWGVDDSGIPKSWPMRLTNAHWAAVLPGVAAGEYTFRVRSVDAQGNAQPMPRPFRKSGFADIESRTVRVVG